MHRSKGVTILALFVGIIGALGVWQTVGLPVGIRVTTQVSDLMGLPIRFVVYASCVVFAYGAWRLKPWAWTLAVVASVSLVPLAGLAGGCHTGDPGVHQRPDIHIRRRSRSRHLRPRGCLASDRDLAGASDRPDTPAALHPLRGAIRPFESARPDFATQGGLTSVPRSVTWDMKRPPSGRFGGSGAPSTARSVTWDMKRPPAGRQKPTNESKGPPITAANGHQERAPGTATRNEPQNLEAEASSSRSSK